MSDTTAEDVLDLETTNAVLAHSLLGSVGAVTGSLSTVLHRFDRLDDDRKQQLLSMALEQANFIAEVLKDMVRGLPPEIIAALDELRRIP